MNQASVAVNTQREKAWKLMRTVGNFTITEIATLAEADYDLVAYYVRSLMKHGYLRHVGKQSQEGRPGCDKVYRVAKSVIGTPLRRKVRDTTARPVPEGKIRLGGGVKTLCPRKKLGGDPLDVLARGLKPSEKVVIESTPLRGKSTKIYDMYQRATKNKGGNHVD